MHIAGTMLPYGGMPFQFKSRVGFKKHSRLHSVVLYRFCIMLALAAFRYTRFAVAAGGPLNTKWSMPYRKVHVQQRCLTSKKDLQEETNLKPNAYVKEHFSSPSQAPTAPPKNEPLPTTKKSNVLELGQYMTRRMRKGIGGFFSAIGFVSSATTALLTDRAQFQRFKPTVQALRNFLKTSGIDLEFSKSLNHRLLENVIILRRIQSAATEGSDRRDLALLSGSRSLDWVPTREEALR